MIQLFLMGKEDVDANDKSHFIDYIKSKLFTVPSILISQYVIYLIILTIILFVFKHDHSELQLVLYWSILAMIISIPFSIYLFSLVKKTFTLKLESKLILKYFLVSITIFTIIYLITEEFLVYTENIFEFIPQLLLFMITGVISYLLITYFVDLRIRKLFAAIINQLKNNS